MKPEIAETITQHALVAVGSGNFYRLDTQDGKTAGAFYRSEIEPYLWVMTRGMGIAGMHADRNELARRNGVLIADHQPDTPTSFPPGVMYIVRWLASLGAASTVDVSDGGPVLHEATADGKLTGTYLEIGGPLKPGYDPDAEYDQTS